MARELPQDSPSALQHLQVLSWLREQLSHLQENLGEQYQQLSYKQKALVASAVVVATFTVISFSSMFSGNLGLSQTAISGTADDSYPVYSDPEHPFPVGAPPSPLYEAVVPDDIDLILNKGLY